MAAIDHAWRLLKEKIEDEEKPKKKRGPVSHLPKSPSAPAQATGNVDESIFGTERPHIPGHDPAELDEEGNQISDWTDEDYAPGYRSAESFPGADDVEVPEGIDPDTMQHIDSRKDWSHKDALRALIEEHKAGPKEPGALDRALEQLSGLGQRQARYKHNVKMAPKLPGMMAQRAKEDAYQQRLRDETQKVSRNIDVRSHQAKEPSYSEDQEAWLEWKKQLDAIRGIEGDESEEDVQPASSPAPKRQPKAWRKTPGGDEQ